MKKRILVVTTVCIIVIIITLGVQLFKNNTVDNAKNIKVNEVTRSVFYAPQYVAIQKGFFKEEGIEIDLTTGQGAETPLT